MSKRIRLVRRRAGVSRAEFEEGWPLLLVDALVIGLPVLAESPYDGVELSLSEAPRPLVSALEGDALTILAEEKVLRGADWLRAHRRENTGGGLLHMALTRRAEGLSRQEFQRRWQQHAGTVGTTTIPDDVRGRAYVQNHPLPGDWPYDAINEVYLDDEAALRARMAWFAANATAGDLFGSPTFLALREISP